MYWYVDIELEDNKQFISNIPRKCACIEILDLVNFLIFFILFFLNQNVGTYAQGQKSAHRPFLCCNVFCQTKAYL